MKKIFSILLSSLLFANIANAQVVSGGASAPYTLHSQEFTSTGANSFTVPSGVTSLLVDACAAGAGGGGGSSAVNPGGGGAGGSGQWVAGYPLTVVANTSLTITIPTAGTGGVAGGAGADGTAGGNLTITGAVDTFPTLYGGSPGLGANGFYFGAGGDGGGPNGTGGVGDNSILGNPSTLARPAFVFPYGGGGAGGGRGGGYDPYSGADPPSVGSSYGLPNGSFFSLGYQAGAYSGGGGAPSPYGNGGLGGEAYTSQPGTAPTIGYCGSGGGGGGHPTTPTAGGAGAKGFARVRW